jgi:putative redox protein
MSIETVQADWLVDQEFLLKDTFGSPILMAQPQGVRGADLLPLSLIGCAGWEVADILRKQRQPVHSLRIFADSQREDAPPWRFTRIHIRYQIGGQGLNPEKIQRAIELTEARYCSIYATLRACLEITSDFQIVEE